MKLSQLIPSVFACAALLAPTAARAISGPNVAPVSGASRGVASVSGGTAASGCVGVVLGSHWVLSVANINDGTTAQTCVGDPASPERTTVRFADADLVVSRMALWDGDPVTVEGLSVTPVLLYTRDAMNFGAAVPLATAAVPSAGLVRTLRCTGRTAGGWAEGPGAFTAVNRTAGSHITYELTNGRIINPNSRGSSFDVALDGAAPCVNDSNQLAALVVNFTATNTRFALATHTLTPWIQGTIAQ